jgi:hypothetical protein
MSAPRADETEEDRLNRNLDQLISELRVALPGVQVLFAFLLAVPFNQRFARATAAQRDVYIATLLCAALASACLIGPSAHHRVLFHQHDKPHMVRVANVLAIAGLAFLAIAVTGAVLLVGLFLFTTTAALAMTVMVGLVFGGIWFAYPLWRRLRD